jgi:hypothetical protein
MSANLDSSEDVRRPPVSRSLFGERERIDEVPKATPELATTSKRFSTTALNVWSGPGEKYKLRTEVDTGTKLRATGVEVRGWAQVVLEGRFAWVNADYLAKKKPVVEDEETVATAGGVTQAPCPLGSSVEAGLTPDAVRVYRSVCANFPAVTSYGGVRPDDGEHGTGQALDIMATGALGDEIAAWVRANASALGVSEVLWAQQIWTVERSSEGWRYFEDRGSATANHFDHVHVTVYGYSGG